MSGRGRVLIVEDVPALAETYAAFLRTEGCQVDIANSGRQALAALAARPPEIMVLDVHLPDVNGLAILREVRDRGLPTDVVVVTSQVSISLAVTAMQQGAFDYLTKPFTADRLRVTVRNALERRRLETQVAAVQDEVGRDQFCGFIGQSMAMQSVYRILTNAAASSAAVLVTGERGTGKRLCGQALHKLGRRRQKPFVTVDCAALTQDQLDAEIFGRWARVATADREGALLRANGGTLFLDEVCLLESELQEKLLRFLQTSAVLRMDEDRPDRSTCAWSARPTAILVPRSPPGGSARTCSTGWRSFPSGCRRCASAMTTFCCWRGISCERSRARSASRSRNSRRKPKRRSWRTIGPATRAS